MSYSWFKMFVLVAALAGCGKEEAQQISNLQAKVEDLNKTLKVAQAKVTELEADNARLKETDQFRFQKAVDIEAAGNITDAIKAFQDVATKFPASPLAESARKKSESLNRKLKVMKQDAQAALESLDDRLYYARDATAMESILNEVAQKYPFEEVAKVVAGYRKDLSALLEKEKEQAKALKEMGIEISNVRTYWTLSEGSTSDRLLVVPYIRFTVKNVGDQPITKLYAKAAFEVVEHKKLLGTGTAYAIGSGDMPLKPGFSKQVFFASDIGYLGFTYTIAQPATAADLYLQTNDGPEKLVATLDIERRFDRY